jgi:hypothetical protein
MRTALLSILIVLSVPGFAGAAQLTSPSAGYAQDARVLVYPNPAKDRVYVKGTAAVRIEIINMIGDIVLHEEIAGGTVSLSDIQPGLYIVRIYDADDALILSSRLTKQ